MTTFNLTNCPITQVCRTCAQCFDQESNLNSIFEDIKDIKYTQNHFSIKSILILMELSINENDGLPQQICYTCLEKVIDVYRFKDECKYAQDKLRQYFKKFSDSPKSFAHMDIAPIEFCKIENNTDYDTIENLQENKIEKENQVQLSNEESDKILKLNDEKTELDKNLTLMGVKSKKRKKVRNSTLTFTSMKKDEIKEKGGSKPKKRKKNASVPVQCEICGVIIMNKNLKLHLQCKHKIDHGLNPDKRKYINNQHLSCPICHQKFSIPSGLERHMILHNNPERKHTCSICQHSFKRAWCLKRHIGAVHMEMESKEVECRYCDRTFKDADKRYVHERHHKNESHVCDICNKYFKTKVILRLHKRRHTGEKYCFCLLCEKSFVDNTGLRRHYRSKHTAEEIENLNARLIKNENS